ncbi:LuxR C-terminal-related transcriptional regulator [Nocardia sp. NPDC049149]|uniref:helix-turn-helix transcriptional regulator n=1 Tax=Nocardia sp. NPDC049149 TaxID=3364315 RepID=UPI0037223A0F
MSSRLRERTFARMLRLTSADLGTAELIDEAAELLATAIPYDSACWHTTDPDSLIETGFRAYDMPPPDAGVARFAYLPQDFNSFTTLAAGARHSGVLSEVTGGRLDRSIRYRELLRPNSMQGELRTALVIDGACWGNISLFRAAPHDFTADDRDFAHDLAGVLGRGLRTAGVRARSAADSEVRWPGVLVLDANGQVTTISAPARAWLADLGAPEAPEHDALPFAMLALAERARTDGDVATRVRAASGRWVSLHASATGAQVSFVLQQANPSTITPLLYAAFGLTAREREITDLVVAGCSTGEIAEQLFISPLTVQAHLTAVFTKTGIRSRRKLAVLLRGDAGAGNTTFLG